MKKSLCLLVTGLFVASLAAQVATNPTTPPAAPAPLTVEETPAPAPSAPPPPAVATPKPAPKPKPKPSVRKKKAAKPVNLVPGPAVVAGSNINVRAQATIASEVITRLNRGESVTLIEVVTLKRTLDEEPAQWARIAFPTNAPVYIHTGFVDATNKVVTASVLNLRAGPGENHSIVGRIQRSDPVSEIATQGLWMSIQPPTNAYAFIAAEFLTQDAALTAPPPPPAATTEVAVATPPAPVEPAPVEPAPPTPPVAVEPPTPPVAVEPPAPPVAVEPPAPNVPAVATAPEATNAPTAAVEPETPLPPRIVQREGYVRPTVSIQASSSYELVDIYHRRTMDFIYSTSPELVLKRYDGKRVFITGEECFDPRWPNTPVLLIQKIQVVE